MSHRLTSLLSTRHASLADLGELLRARHAAQLDVVTAASGLTAVDGQLVLRGAGEAQLSETGVSATDIALTPTAHADADIAAKLDIPIKYLRRLRAEHLGLYDANVGGWLEREPQRRFLVRGLLDPNGSQVGIARALLSDTYRVVDNLDVLMAMLADIRESGVGVQVTGCDLSERRMYVQVRCEALAQYAPALLAGYTSPFSGARGADNPLVFPGFVVCNSETGDASFSITPRLVVQVCDNGLTLTKDVMRERNLSTCLRHRRVVFTERPPLGGGVG